jgi:hypothetical protein
MVRNFVTTITDLPAPKRGWRKNAGPRESSFTATRIIAISGATATSRTSAPSRSITSFNFQEKRPREAVVAVSATRPWLATAE